MDKFHWKTTQRHASIEIWLRRIQAYTSITIFHPNPALIPMACIYTLLLR